MVGPLALEGDLFRGGELLLELRLVGLGHVFDGVVLLVPVPGLAGHLVADFELPGREISGCVPPALASKTGR